MKKYVTTAAVCGCLLIGSLYPQLLLKHHVRLFDSQGYEIELDGEYQKEIPVKLESGILKFFCSLK